VPSRNDSPLALFIEPGSPWENGYCESFNGKLRDELLNREILDRLKEAKIAIERWRKHYNTSSDLTRRSVIDRPQPVTVSTFPTLLDPHPTMLHTNNRHGTKNRSGHCFHGASMEFAGATSANKKPAKSLT
jgi:Integrase core domain